MDTPHDGPRVLLIDSYDSFTNNLACLIGRAIPSASIYIIKNDQLTPEQLSRNLRHFSAAVVGPGPGSPENPADVGRIVDLWRAPDEQVIPVFGVCLGLQSLAIEFGAQLKRLPVVKHGQVSTIHHSRDSDSDGLFTDTGDIRAVRYHSLHVDITGCAKLEELAWVDDVEDNGHVTMAVKYKVKPFWAVQYHPESVCTDKSGHVVLQNFWRLASAWRDEHSRKPSCLGHEFAEVFGRPWPDLTPSQVMPPIEEASTPIPTTSIHVPQLNITQICEVLGAYKSGTDFVLLDSAAHPGRYSITACILPSTPRFTYRVGDNYVTTRHGEIETQEPLLRTDIWTWISDFMRPYRKFKGDSSIPFWGGIVGYLSYELGVDSLGCRKTSTGHPDVNLVFVERSLVLDKLTGEVFIQSLLPDDHEWMTGISSTLRRAASAAAQSGNSVAQEASDMRTLAPISVAIPDKDRYISKVKEAKEYLFAGESYELCVTARTRIQVQSESSWEFFKRVRRVNPAPYGAYIRLNNCTLISSSPERFLSYTRGPHQKCQLRPIKGTVRKSPEMTRPMAEAILGSTKEVAENLMIVDLIRHDLHGVVGPGVQVKKFCGVEEYKTVWQSVSVIEGEAKHAAGDKDWTLGWDVLKSSLPPGSMTGAPKKRSVEILQHLEDDDRGIYSGVVGYQCVGGGGDWAVIIRSCYNYPSEACPTSDKSTGDFRPTQEWLVGSGGAITALSDPEAEWDEMCVKLQSVLRAFQPDGALPSSA